jgi:3-hydroxyisobutyrate dehydrogenase
VIRADGLGVPSLDAAGPLASFGLAENLGYGDQISNRVVDAIGDVAGGVRVADPVLDKPEG